MYRQYEDPYKLERLLHDAETALDNAMRYNPDDKDLLLTLQEEVRDLWERTQYAWQDYEADLF